MNISNTEHSEIEHFDKQHKELIIQSLKNNIDISVRLNDLINLPLQKKAIGLDWGTTRSGAAVVDPAGGLPVMIENPLGCMYIFVYMLFVQMLAFLGI